MVDSWGHFHYIKNMAQTKNTDTVALVTVYGGGVIEFTRGDIAEILENKASFKQADNLPKWFFVASGCRTYRWSVIEALAVHTGAPAEITVRSDWDRSRHFISGLNVTSRGIEVK